LLDLLKSQEARRLLLWITGITGLTLLIVQWLTVLGLMEPVSIPKSVLLTLQLVASGLFAGVAASAYLAFVTRYLFKHDQKLDRTEVLDSLTTRRMHLEEADRSDIWWHNGHIGRWVRTTVIPKFAKAAHEGVSKEVRMILIDPRNDQIVDAYAEHRDQVDAIPEGQDTREDARIEVLATILKAALTEQHVPGVKVTVNLRQHLDLFRVDICDDAAFTTLTRDKVPAILYRKQNSDSDHYYVARKNFDQAVKEAASINLAVPMPRTPTVPDVEQFLVAIGMEDFKDRAESVLSRSKSSFNRTP